MKKVLFSLVALCICIGAKAQIKVSEPDFVGSHYLLTSDSTYIVLPKEIGQLKEHKSKAGLFSKVASAVGSVGGAVGAATAMLGQNVGALTTGLQVMTTANSVEAIGGAVGALGHASGMDVVFDGRSSTARTSKNDVRIIIKADNNNIDPADLYRVVSFKSSKKERRMQWLEIRSAILGSSEAKQKGYIPFTASKYGDSSYLITIPTSELSQGEYGIFLINNPAVQAATFGIE